MSTPAGGRASEADESTGGAEPGPVDLWSAFKRAHEVVRARVIADTAEAVGLSEPDLTILVSLSKAGGSLRQSELAAALGWDRTRTSHHLTRMGRRGLVTRERSGGASVTVTLTDTGGQAITAAQPGLDAAVRRHFTDKLSADEMDVLSSVLRRL